MSPLGIYSKHPLTSNTNTVLGPPRWGSSSPASSTSHAASPSPTAAGTTRVSIAWEFNPQAIAIIVVGVSHTHCIISISTNTHRIQVLATTSYISGDTYKFGMTCPKGKLVWKFRTLGFSTTLDHGPSYM